MELDEREVRAILGHAMVARIATLSRSGRPSVTPLYFVAPRGRIWLGTADWTLAARDVRADPHASVLINAERDPADRRVVRVVGAASLRTDLQTQAEYVLRVALKYSLTLGQVRNTLGHWRLIALRRRYHAQSAAKGRACVIEVVPERVELIDG
jgi:predicted pyridoxine 5'-phosphate oxidase superfamily flavin-nucleotide-binding protein